MATRRRLKTVRDIIATLGGPAEFASFLDLNHRQQTAEFVRQGYIPSKYFVRVAVGLEAMGFAAPYTLFGFIAPARTRGSALLKVLA